MHVAINTPHSKVGQSLVQQLVDLGASVSVLSRRPEALAPSLAGRVRVVRGSLDDAAAVAELCAGADALFWLSPPAIRPDFDRWVLDSGTAAARLAASAGVGHAVVLSSIGAQHPAGLGPVTPLHALERIFLDALAGVTVIRAGFFFENVERDLPSIAGQGAVYNAIPSDKRLPWVSAVDVGHRAAAVLVEGPGGHRTVGVHGPQDLTWAEMARVLSDGLGFPVQHHAVTVDAARAAMRGFGMPDFAVDSYAEFYEAVLAGRMDPAEPRTAATTTPTTFAAYVRTTLAPAVATARQGSSRVMVHFRVRDGVSQDELAARLPAEREAFAGLVRSGRVIEAHLALGRRDGWAVLRGRDAADARAAFETLPLAPSFDIETWPLE